jgi:hypothetical protein
MVHYIFLCFFAMCSLNCENFIEVNYIFILFYWKNFTKNSKNFDFEKSFYENEVITKIKLKRQFPVEFPAVSICSVNPFNNVKSDYIKNILQSQKPRNESSNKPPIASLPDELNYRLSTLNSFYIVQSNLSSTNETFRRNFSLPINQFIISCSYDKENCDLNKFQWYYDKLLGNCYRFNSLIGNENNSDIRRSYKPGKIYGLQLEIYFGNFNSISPWLLCKKKN